MECSDFCGPLETGNEREDRKNSVLVALFILGGRIGCAVYKEELCMVECFERNVGGSTLCEGEVMAGVETGKGSVPGLCGVVPNGLRWLVCYLDAWNASVLLPDSGAGVLDLLVREYCRGTVMRLTAKSAFNREELFPRLQRLYPEVSEEAWKVRLNWQHEAMLGALSALLHVVTHVKSNVMNVVETSDPSIMYIDDYSMKFLQISCGEAHPCEYQGVGCSKEGLSLLSLLQHTESPAGAARLALWMALPSQDVVELRERQEMVEFFAHPTRQPLLAVLRRSLHRIIPPERLLPLLRNGRATLRHYRHLRDTVESVLFLFYHLSRLAHQFSFAQKFVSTVTEAPLKEMLQRLRRTIAGIQSGRREQQESSPVCPTASSGAVVVTRARCSAAEEAVRCPPQQAGGALPPQILPEADPSGRLLELHARLEDVDLAVRHQVECMKSRIPAAWQAAVSLECVWEKSVSLEVAAMNGEQSHTPLGDGERYWVIGKKSELTKLAQRSALPSNEAAESSFTYLLNAIHEMTGLRYCGEEIRGEPGSGVAQEAGSSRTYYAYFSSTELDAVSEGAQQLQRERQRLEHLVRVKLDDWLVMHLLYLFAPCDAAASLDCLLSFAFVTERFGWAIPTLHPAGAGCLRIAGGWHPILGSVVSRHGSLVTFTLDIREPDDRVCLFLGVNGSGKTILISAVALIVFLAQIGCGVPAERVEVSLVSSIRVASPVSIQDQASFYAECVALGRTLAHTQADHQYLLASEARGTATPTGAGEDPHSAREAEEAKELFRPSLILIDELGKGTSPEDGRALLSSVLRYFTGVAPFYPNAPSHASSSCRSNEVKGMYQGVSSDRHAASLARTWRPIVLCATHYTDMLDRTGELQLHRLAPIAAFPFEHVHIYDMQSHAVFPPAPGNHRRNGEAIDESPSSLVLPVDVIPTFRPVCVTKLVQEEGECGHRPHEKAYFDYYHSREGAARSTRGATALGRRCGLHPLLQQWWEQTLTVVLENGGV